MRAQQEVRILKQQSSLPITVFLREGIYYLNETIEFGLEDSGNGENGVWTFFFF